MGGADRLNFWIIDRTENDTGSRNFGSYGRDCWKSM